MFKNLKNLYLAAFDFTPKHTSDGPDARLVLHDDPYYYFK